MSRRIKFHDINADVPISINCTSMSGFPRSLSSKLAKAPPAHIPSPVFTNNKTKTHSPKNKVTSIGNLAKKQIGSQIDKSPGKAINKSAKAFPLIINDDSTGLDFMIHSLLPSTPRIVEPSIVHCNRAPRYRQIASIPG